MWTRFNEALEMSLTRVLTSLADLLPSVVALVVLALVALVAGVAISVALRRSLQRLRFDRRMELWGFGNVSDWSPQGSPTQLVSRVAFWGVLLLGLLLALSVLDARLASEFAGRVLTYLPNVLAAVVLLLVGTLAARIVGRAVLVSAVNMQLQSARLLSLGAKWLVMVLVGAMALDHLGVGGSIVRLAFGILFGGIVFALALAVGLGSKEAVSRTLERATERNARAAEPSREEYFSHL